MYVKGPGAGYDCCPPEVGLLCGGMSVGVERTLQIGVLAENKIEQLVVEFVIQVGKY